MLTPSDHKYLRLVRGLEQSLTLLADMEARPYSWLNECRIARQRQVVQFREYKLNSFMQRNGAVSKVAPAYGWRFIWENYQAKKPCSH